MFIAIQGRIPVASAAPVSSFGTATIATPMGNRRVYTVVLATPLTSSQIAAIAALPPNIRIESSNNFFAYLIPAGYLSPSGTPLPPVSSDGSTLVVDNWVRTAPPIVPARAGAVPSGSDSGPYSVTVDALHQVDLSYGGWSVLANDRIVVAIGDERAHAVERTSVPALNLYDPLNTSLLTMDRFVGVIANTEGGAGVGMADDVCNVGWQVCYVARNMPSAKTGTTIGFLVPAAGPTVGFYSTQQSGDILIADPGATGSKTIIIDTHGNAYFSGNLATANVTSVGSVKGAVIKTVGGSIAAFNSAGTQQTAAIDGSTGNIVTQGLTSSGALALSSLNSRYPCTPQFLGAHFYVTDGRKPGEAAGKGSGVPVDCTPRTRGASPSWVSVYDHLAVVN